MYSNFAFAPILVPALTGLCLPGTKENAHLKRIRRILDEELPMIVKEVRWIEMVRAYAGMVF